MDLDSPGLYPVLYDGSGECGENLTGASEVTGGDGVVEVTGRVDKVT